jgi:hypothetical protein
MMNKVLGFLMVALPGVAGFAAYGLAKDKGMSAITSAALAGAAFAAADVGGQLLSGGISGLTFENVGLLLNAHSPIVPAYTREQRMVQGRPGFGVNSTKFGYLVPQTIGACFGQC